MKRVPVASGRLCAWCGELILRDLYTAIPRVHPPHVSYVCKSCINCEFSEQWHIQLDPLCEPRWLTISECMDLALMHPDVVDPQTGTTSRLYEYDIIQAVKRAFEFE